MAYNKLKKKNFYRGRLNRVTYSHLRLDHHFPPNHSFQLSLSLRSSSLYFLHHDQVICDLHQYQLFDCPFFVLIPIILCNLFLKLVFLFSNLIIYIQNIVFFIYVKLDLYLSLIFLFTSFLSVIL